MARQPRLATPFSSYATGQVVAREDHMTKCNSIRIHATCFTVRTVPYRASF